MADEVRLIDAKLLTTNIAQIAKNCARSDAQKALIGRILFMIENMPTIEAEPVKHGRWELITQNKFTGTKTLRCTYCKNYFVVRDDTLNAGRGDANFCPNCGSKHRMDGDSDG